MPSIWIVGSTMVDMITPTEEAARRIAQDAQDAGESGESGDVPIPDHMPH
jgi:hypothetical protein